MQEPSMQKLRITVNGRVYEVTVELLESVGDEVSASTRWGLSSRRGGQTLKAPGPEEVAPRKAPPVSGTAPTAGPLRADTAVPVYGSGAGEAAGTRVLKAPLPGVILDIPVRPGDDVRRGQVLVILEAMKMQNELLAECDGRVEEIHVVKGQSVGTGEPLITMTC